MLPIQNTKIYNDLEIVFIFHSIALYYNMKNMKYKIKILAEKLEAIDI